MKKSLFTALLALLFSYCGYAQTLDQLKLDRYFKVLDSGKKFMGSAAILKDGKIVYTKAIGFKSLADQQKADIHTKYRIGSISKTFTATLVLKAVEEKKVLLSDPIASYFPSIKNVNNITLSQLLNHRSGIPNFTNNPDYLNWYTQKKSEQELVKLIGASGSDFEPGTKAAYSNSNYVLLSFILEKIYALW
jgi:D-alanyl-D-alanine carboxypeptidase